MCPGPPCPQDKGKTPILEQILGSATPLCGQNSAGPPDRNPGSAPVEGRGDLVREPMVLLKLKCLTFFVSGKIKSPFSQHRTLHARGIPSCGRHFESRVQARPKRPGLSRKAQMLYRSVCSCETDKHSCKLVRFGTCNPTCVLSHIFLELVPLSLPELGNLHQG